MFEIYDEPEPSNERACFRYMMNPNREMRGHVKIHDEPESPHAPESKMGGPFFKIFDEPESPKGRV